MAVPPKATRTGEEGAPLPLVLAFHGYRETPESMSGYGRLGQDGALVVYAGGIGGAWSGAPYAKSTKQEDFQFVQDLIDRVSATYNVDQRRIYAAGMSNGGGFVAKLACEMPEQFAALGSVAGAYYPGTYESCVDQSASGPVRFTSGHTAPFLEIHGEQDATIEYRGGTRHSTPYLPVMTWMNAYAGRAGCEGSPRTTRVSNKILQVQWPGCANADGRGEVMHLQVADMQHRWPLAKPDASAELLKFFARHAR